MDVLFGFSLEYLAYDFEENFMKKAFDVDRNLIFFCRDIIKCSFGGFF